MWNVTRNFKSVYKSLQIKSTSILPFFHTIGSVAHSSEAPWYFHFYFTFDRERELKLVSCGEKNSSKFFDFCLKPETGFLIAWGDQNKRAKTISYLVQGVARKLFQFLDQLHAWGPLQNTQAWDSQTSHVSLRAKTNQIK